MLTIANLRAYLPGKSALIAAATIALLGFLVGRSGLAAHDEAINLAATMRVQNQVLSQANERERQRDASLAATLAQINAEKRRANTPAKAAAAIPQVLPPLPQPINLQLPAPTPQVPDPPATATIPQADLKPIYDYVEDCRACQASLAATQSDLTDERAKLATVTAERDAAIKTARGGNLWSRLRHNAKWFALGAAAATIATATRN